MGTSEMPQNGAALVATKEFGRQSMEVRHETSSVAVAAQARATTEARYAMALQRPRDFDDVRIGLLADLKRPRFAESARYVLPIGGKKIRGWTIRFAESVMRRIGNLLPETCVMFDSPAQRIVRVSLTDLEANLTYSKDIVIEKTIERRNPKEGTIVIGQRINSSGDNVFIVQATDEESAVKQAALESRVLRNHALRLMPSDILEDCLDAYQVTVSERDAKNPDEARKKLVDAFAAIGVKPSDIKGYVGHEIDVLTQTELTDLREIYTAVKDGETRWADVMEINEGKMHHVAKDETPEAPVKAKTTADLKAREKAKAKVESPDEAFERWDIKLSACKAVDELGYVFAEFMDKEPLGSRTAIHSRVQAVFERRREKLQDEQDQRDAAEAEAAQ